MSKDMIENPRMKLDTCDAFFIRKDRQEKDYKMKIRDSSGKWRWAGIIAISWLKKIEVTCKQSRHQVSKRWGALMLDSNKSISFTIYSKNNCQHSKNLVYSLAFIRSHNNYYTSFCRIKCLNLQGYSLMKSIEWVKVI